MPEEKDSPAIQFLQKMWDHVQGGTSHSWLKLNHAMHDTIRLAIRGGMKFESGDFNVIYSRFRAGYWVGSDSEWIYNLAVLYRHRTAWSAYEKWAGRKPFIEEYRRWPGWRRVGSPDRWG